MVSLMIPRIKRLGEPFSGRDLTLAARFIEPRGSWEMRNFGSLRRSSSWGRFSRAVPAARYHRCNAVKHERDTRSG